jgi:hypothetical protein
MPTSTDSFSRGVTKTRSRFPCSNHQLSISPPSTVTHDDRSRTQELGTTCRPPDLGRMTHAPAPQDDRPADIWLGQMRKRMTIRRGM